MKKEGTEKFSITRIIIFNIISILLILLTITGLFSPLYSIVDLLARDLRTDISFNILQFNDALGTLGNLKKIKRERDELKEKVITLENENSQLRNLKFQNEILQKQIDTNFNENYELIAARVISLDVRNQGYARINKGIKEGIEIGNVIVIQNFVIGEVKEVHEYSSDILLITSPNSEVTVISQNNQTKGILTGRFGGGLVVNSILQTDKLDKDETFVTLGVNSIYPAGLLVGSISDINEVQTETTKSAILSNYVDFDSLRYIFVLKTKK